MYMGRCVSHTGTIKSAKLIWKIGKSLRIFQMSTDPAMAYTRRFEPFSIFQLAIYQIFRNGVFQFSFRFLVCHSDAQFRN